MRRKRLCLLCFQFSDHTKRCVCGRFFCSRCGMVLCIDCMVKAMFSEDKRMSYD